MRPRTVLLPLLIAFALGAAWLAIAASGMPFMARAGLLVFALLVLLFLGLGVLRWFLWSVGRRLGFSYFLIGVVPFPILAVLLFLTAYVAAGVFLGHVYRDAVSQLDAEVRRSAATALARWRTGGPTPEQAGNGFATAYYRDGRRVTGAAAAPEQWPSWLIEDRNSAPAGVVQSPFVALPDGGAAVVGTATVEEGQGELAVLAFAGDDVERRLSDSTGLWVRLLRSDDPRKRSNIQLSIGGRSFSLLPVAGGGDEDAARAEFFEAPTDSGPWFERPWIWWGELTRDFRDLATGEPVTEYVAASLNTSPVTIFAHLFSGSPEVNSTIFVALVAISGMLGSLYLVAVVMAITMIVGLSRAVNRLSRATAGVRAGDFSVRIPGRRHDQVGELQRAFNEMTEGLERAVATRAHQEALESELGLARKLQESLLPVRLPASEAVEFATLFEPSAAIGGDYFDILRLDEDRLAVVIADVSGHGLPSGLRMAMLKAALGILVEEHKGPEEILARLDAMVRSERPRYFITCTISVVDFRRGRLELTNAGHPPAYRIRDEEVEEILVPGSPLGALGDNYGRRELELRSGDTLVWLSDGLIEGTDDADEPFGYERVAQALRGPTPTAGTVRERLLAAVTAHTGGRQPDDDRTLVILRYRGTAAEAGGSDGP